MQNHYPDELNLFKAPPGNVNRSELVFDFLFFWGPSLLIIRTCLDGTKNDLQRDPTKEEGGI